MGTSLMPICQLLQILCWAQQLLIVEDKSMPLAAGAQGNFALGESDRQKVNPSWTQCLELNVCKQLDELRDADDCLMASTCK